MERPVRFVILFLGRTGSTHLVSILDSSPVVRAEGEVLVGFSQPERQIKRARWSFDQRETPELLAVGLKTKIGDILDWEAFKELLYEVKCRVIYLDRRNHVKWAISRLNAIRLHERTGQWNLEQKAPPLEPLEVDYANFDEILRATSEWVSSADRTLNELNLPLLRISYEQLLADREATVSSVCSFIDIPHVSSESDVRKNTDDDLRKSVVNFEALRSRYIGTRYEAMFDEVLVRANE